MMGEGCMYGMTHIPASYRHAWQYKLLNSLVRARFAHRLEALAFAQTLCIAPKEIGANWSDH